MLNITNIDDCNFSLSGTIGSGLKVYYKKGFFAKACEPVYNETYGRINIQDKTERIISRTPVNQVGLDNVVYATAEEFVTAFNNMISECCCVQVEPTTTELPLALELTWDDILNVPVADASSVSDWNTFFDLPTNGNPFTLVEIEGNTVKLIGGSNITIVDGLEGGEMPINFGANTHLISIIDNGCIVNIGIGSFVSCSNLASVSMPAVTNLGFLCFANDFSLANFFAASVYQIGESCFLSCASLVEVSFPTLLEMGNNAFTYCSSLVSVSTPIITEFNHDTFYGCTSLTSVYAPLVTITGDRCFSKCTSLETISLPSVIRLNYDSFNECTSLINIDIPLCEIIINDCFYLCTSLQTISLPSATFIDEHIFYGCASLINISMPVVTTLGVTDSLYPVFEGITGNTITLTIPHAIENDDDIVYLKANNTVTVVYSD